MKKTVSLILTLACILTSLCGCDSLNRTPVSLGDSISIPESGIIEASVFEAMKADNQAVTFWGQSGDIRYEWVIFGNAVKEAKDVNLGLEILDANAEKVKFRFLSEENFGFPSALSIYLNDSWNAQSAAVREDSVDSSEKQEVSITGGRQTVLNFTPNVQIGTFVITPHAEPDTSTPVTSDTPDAENTATTSPSEPSETLPSVPPASSDRPISDGKNTEQDEYKTDPVPEGKPLPVEPDDQELDARKTYTCTFSIECTSIFNHLSDLEPDKLDILPKNGVILATQTVAFYEGESVFDVLQRVCRENKIHMESSFTPMYNSAYVEGIGNLYEFDCGPGSGWMYRVDGWYPNYGCSRYQLKPGEKVEWRYTCDLGNDIGGGYAIGSQ